MPVQIAPSLMCADILRLGDDVDDLARVGVDLLHFDLMDAHFVPNMPMGLGVLEGLRQRTKVPFDVHLMVQDNDWFIAEVAKIGAEQIAIHAESAVHLDRSLALIRSHGIQAGVALNPATPLEALDYVLERIDFVLLMTVNPGFAGQALVESGLRKIKDCREYLDSRGRKDVPISVDGNVSFENIPKMVGAGADILVAGTSSLFKKGEDRDGNFATLKSKIDEGLAQRSGDSA
ncbi:MAG: ribulose-phosphate 3-epimerase [Planctomycetota bacterium]